MTNRMSACPGMITVKLHEEYIPKNALKSPQQTSSPGKTSRFSMLSSEEAYIDCLVRLCLEQGVSEAEIAKALSKEGVSDIELNRLITSAINSFRQQRLKTEI